MCFRGLGPCERLERGMGWVGVQVVKSFVCCSCCKDCGRPCFSVYDGCGGGAEDYGSILAGNVVDRDEGFLCPGSRWPGVRGLDFCSS